MNSNHLSRATCMATAVSVALCLATSVCGGVATAASAEPAPNLPAWYTTNIVTEGCWNPVAVDDANVQLSCHAAIFKPAVVANQADGLWGMWLRAEVHVPEDQLPVDAATYLIDDTTWLLPIRAYRINPGDGHNFSLNSNSPCPIDNPEIPGRTLVARAPLFTASDFTVTIHPSNLGSCS
ncbi:hypothetical protein LQL77_31240 [Rhodococcus cerastii]|nr:hypothetical protein [Rhodococcus cerastii]